VHIEAVSAAIDLRSAELDQFEQQRLETALVNILLHGRDGSIDFGIEFLHADSLIHCLLPLMFCADRLLSA
jgi:hypothetical protein